MATAERQEKRVGLLDRFEQRLDRLVNGAFAKAFKAEVQPVELASALQREMDDRSAVVARGLVPGLHVVLVGDVELRYEEGLRSGPI